MAGKVKTESQVKFLLSKGSPLSEEEKEKLRKELASGEVRVVKDTKKDKR